MSSFKNTMAFGDFNSLNIPENERETYECGVKAVNSVEGGWDFLKTYEPGHGGFMLSKNPPKMNEIETAIHKFYGGHSGGSYGDTMRKLEFIAKEGWDAFAKEMIREYGLPNKSIPTSIPPPINTNLPPNPTLKDHELHLNTALGILAGSIHSELILAMDKRQRAILCNENHAEYDDQERSLQELQESLNNLRTALDNYFTQVHKFIG